MDREDEKVYEQENFAGIQQKTTEFLQEEADLNDAQNTRYDTIGGVKPAGGYAQAGNDLTSTTTTSTSTSTTTTSTSTSTSTTSTSSSTSTSTSTTTTA